MGNQQKDADKNREPQQDQTQDQKIKRGPEPKEDQDQSNELPE